MRYKAQRKWRKLQERDEITSKNGIEVGVHSVLDSAKGTARPCFPGSLTLGGGKKRDLGNEVREDRAMP